MKEAQEKMMELQSYQQQMQQLAQHHEMFSQHRIELLQTMAALGEMSKKEIHIPLGSGVYLPAKTEELERVIVKVGSNIAVEKKRSEVQSEITLQIAEIELMRENVEAHVEKIMQKSEELQKELGELQ